MDRRPRLYERRALPTELLRRAVDQICTDDLRLTMALLYYLSYNGNIKNNSVFGTIFQLFAPEIELYGRERRDLNPQPLP